MKKILPVVMLGLGISFAADVLATPAPCSALTHGGRGSAFLAPDGGMDAKLYYDKNSGDGVSGGFGAIVDGHHYSAPLTDSRCDSSIVQLNWSTRTFSGHLVGKLTSTGIVNAYGNINDKLFSNATLDYTGPALSIQ